MENYSMMSVSVNCKITRAPPPVAAADTSVLISPENVRKGAKKTSPHRLLAAAPPSPSASSTLSSPGACSSTSSSGGAVSPSGQTKLLHHFQRPLKKFSLASAFPPNAFSNSGGQQAKALPAQKETQAPPCPHRTASASGLIVGCCGATGGSSTGAGAGSGSGNHVFAPVSPGGVSNGDAARRCMQEESNERKFSSPLDYRDSGVYLGETRRDPVSFVFTY